GPAPEPALRHRAREPGRRVRPPGGAAVRQGAAVRLDQRQRRTQAGPGAAGVRQARRAGGQALMQRRSLPRRAALAALLGAALAHAPAFAQAAAPRVKLATSAGDITLELDAAKAPKTVANFLQYVKDGHYDGTVFHRVIDGFMIQGGGFTADLQQKRTRAPIPLEASNGLRNDRGTIA